MTTSQAARSDSVLREGQIVYSADSHVLEPGDIWTERIEAKFRDRAPHIEHAITRPDGEVVEGEFLVCEGIAPQAVAGFAAADVSDPKDRAEMNQRGYDQLRAGGWDPEQRLKDQEIDGVTLEVIYPSMTMPMFAIQDTPFQQAIFRAYNSWVAEYCGAHSDRLVGLAMISLDDIEEATAELRRGRDLGLRGALIWNDPGPGRTYADREFDPIWAAAAELDMPLSLHILTGKAGTGLGRSLFLVDYMGLPHPTQLSLTAMLTSGVFERHPGLKVVSVENDVGWIAHFLYRLRHAFEEFRYMLDYQDPLSPMEYFARNCWATFQDDPVGVETIDWIGVDRLMWASDYPHGDSTWPESRPTIERNFAGVSAEVVEQITHDNVVKLYGLA